jgi:hypothetical protein
MIIFSTNASSDELLTVEYCLFPVLEMPQTDSQDRPQIKHKDVKVKPTICT